jgi:hypothetical protein
MQHRGRGRGTCAQRGFFLAAEPGAGAKTRLTETKRPAPGGTSLRFCEERGEVREVNAFLNCRTGGWREDPADEECRANLRSRLTAFPTARNLFTLADETSGAPSSIATARRAYKSAWSRCYCDPASPALVANRLHPRASALQSCAAACAD